MYGVGYFLIRNATCYPNRKALIFEEREYTYKELNKKVNILANNLMKLGIKKGDTVGFILYNCDEFVTLFFAIQKIGAVAVPLNYRLLAEEIRENVDYAECKALVYGEEFSETVKLVKETSQFLKIIIRLGGDFDTLPEGDLDLDALSESGSDCEPGVEIEEKDWSVIMYTSGTTGVPKGVVRTHRIVRDYATMFASENEAPKDKHEILLTHSPLFHTAGLGLLMKIMALGGTFITIHRAEGVELLEMIERHRATQVLVIPPVLYLRLSQVKGVEKYNLDSVTEAQSSGGRSSLDITEKMFQLFPNAKVKTSYGSTEVGASTSVVLNKEEITENPNRIYSTGKISNFSEMRIVDEYGKDVPQGVVGEAIIRSTFIFDHYLKNPELTWQAVKEGWYYSQDLFYQDSDGFYYLVDRKQDLIKTGGENVYPQEVETVLRNHSAIEECAVIGIEDDRYGETIAAAIVIGKGMELTAEEVVQFCRQNMPSYKKPRYVGFIDKLPLNSANKIQKSILRENANEIFKLVDN
ncbi:MAG TPA: class I adenylate-forming enzyme family protein [Syntrophomonadaceae bacterium]|nr:class I adenylate-forming enzyme family protein [Syntrophomonadaceae bacterium]